MDLRLKPEHEALRERIRAFLAEHGHRSAPTIAGQRPGPALLAWQKLLLEHGYAGRTVPREYGGYGATPDVMEQHLIDRLHAAQAAARRHRAAALPQEVWTRRWAKQFGTLP